MISKRIKPVVYSNELKKELLADGKAYGFDWYVLNLGMNPAAYIDLGEGEFKEFDKCKYSFDIPVDCHGGVTYHENYLSINDHEMIPGNFIGWDYALFGDYTGYHEIMKGRFFGVTKKKWTTEEIIEEVIDVCRQLSDIQEKKAESKEQKQEDKLLDIMFHYGLEAQVKHLHTEYYELDKAIVEYDYEGEVTARENIAEEIADIMVMLKQIQYHFDIDDDTIEENMTFKIDRQIKRIKEEEKCTLEKE